MGDSRTTGEHFFGNLASQPVPLSAEGASRRIADLEAQMEFLDREIARYRSLIESERIKHSTEMANHQLQSDTRLDNLRREQRGEIHLLHESYRSKLSNRQVESEERLSKAAAEAAKDLAAERERHESILETERNRRAAQLEAARDLAVEEATEEQRRSNRRLSNELKQARATIERLEGEIHEMVEKATTATMAIHHSELAAANMERRIEEAHEQHQRELAEIETQRTGALDRLEAERKRSAATLAELLERSAAVATEADQTRADLVAEQARTEQLTRNALQQARSEYETLLQAADERATRALQRESELESAIARLRQQLGL